MKILFGRISLILNAKAEQCQTQTARSRAAGTARPHQMLLARPSLLLLRFPRARLDRYSSAGSHRDARQLFLTRLDQLLLAVPTSCNLPRHALQAIRPRCTSLPLARLLPRPHSQLHRTDRSHRRLLRHQRRRHRLL